MIDADFRKELEEAWLCEMAYDRKQATDICSGLSFPFIVHLAKCFLFDNTQWYKHWLKEAAGFCVKCDDMRLKPKAKRPTAEFFLQDDSICGEWETAQDIKSVLDIAILRCPEVDRDDATNDEGLRFLDLWEDLRYELADMMADEDTFNRYEYEEVIDQAIKRNK